VEIEMNLNDYFMIFILFRVYIVYRFIPYISKFYCARASRVCKMMGVTLSNSFKIRCILTSKPFICILFSWGTFALIFAYLLKIIEGPVFKANLNTIDYFSYQNCLWNVFVTMTTGKVRFNI
jgi:hypothetical protein